jgi:hypothetical protein
MVLKTYMSLNQFNRNLDQPSQAKKKKKKEKCIYKKPPIVISKEKVNAH